MVGTRVNSRCPPAKNRLQTSTFLRNLPEHSEIHIILTLRGKQRHTEACYCRVSKLLHELKLWVSGPSPYWVALVFCYHPIPLFPWKCRFYQMTLNHLYHGERRYVNINMFPILASDSMFLVGHNKDVHVLVLIEIIS